MTPSSLSSEPVAMPCDRFRLDGQAVLILLPLAGLLALWLGQDGFWAVVRRLVLPDTDDVMRLVGVRDLLAGQGWFDNVQHRYLPPDGAAMHWSRLVDLPLAALIAGVAPWLGLRAAEGLVAALWPPALLLAYLAVLWTGARRLFGFAGACFAVLAATQLPITALFAPGRIDHHNVQALAVTLAVLLVVGPRRSARGAAPAGIVTAFSLAVGLETMPVVAALGLALVLAWVVRPNDEMTRLRPFGIALAIGSIAFFAAQTAPGSWGAAECDALSPPWLVLATGGGLGSAALAHVSPRLPTGAVRLAAAALLGIVVLAAFAGLAPHCVAGPFAALSPEVRHGWLDRVVEVTPLWKIALANPAAAFLIGVPIAAAIVGAILGARMQAGEARRTFLILLAVLATGAAVTLVHLRGFYVGAALVPLVGGWLFDRALRPAPPRAKAGLLAAALLCLGTVSAAPVLVAQEAFGLGHDLAPRRKAGDCASPEALTPLDRLPPGLVLGPIDLGPAILLFTRHAIVAAPYHRNQDGIAAGLALESGSSERLEAAIDRYRPDYLAACSAWVLPPEGPMSSRLEPIRLGAGDLRVWRVTPPPAR